MTGCIREMGLAARYVSGYLRTIPPPGAPRLVGADASHAWTAAWCGPLHWVDFDPTNNCLVDDNHVTVAWGRDYGDVCPIQGVFVGGGGHQMNVSVDVAPIE
jgi:transglutaminase-like putative cysteine protease